MSKLRLFVLSSFVSTGMAATLLVACSSDTSISVASEVDADVDTDAQTKADATSKSDADVQKDSGENEDGSVEDDASQDAGPDAEEFDGGLTVESYVDLVATTLCSSISRCCFGPTPIPDGGAVDGGTYDSSACVGLSKDLGFDETNFGNKYVSTERVTLNTAKASECLKKIEALSCSLGGTEIRAARAACYAAIAGKQGAGDPCTVSMECAQGYCKPVDPTANPTTANGGVCTSLVGANGKCGTSFTTNDIDINAQYADEACSTRTSGDTGFHCGSYDYTLDDYPSQPDWKCVPNVANGEGCSTTRWCATGICDYADYRCKDPVTFLGKSCPLLIKNP